MVGPNFWDLADSKNVPHAQIGEGRCFSPQKRQGYSLASFEAKKTDPRRFGRVAHFWNRIGPRSWVPPSGGLYGPYGAFNRQITPGARFQPYLAEGVGVPLALEPHQLTPGTVSYTHLTLPTICSV